MPFQHHCRGRSRLAAALSCCLLGAAIAAVGCSSGADSSSTGRGRPSQAEIDAFHESLCESALRCCNAEADSRVEECKLNLRERGRGYDPQAGEACLAELARAEENGQCWAVGFGPSDSCRNIWSERYGTSGAGDPCGDDSDCIVPDGGMSVCIASRSCVWLFPGEPGDARCLADVVTRLDFTLFYTDGSVPEGVYCSDADGVHCEEESWTCRALSPDGEPCTASKGCISGDCVGGVCEALVPSGGTCSGAGGCVDSAFCDNDALCDDSGVCTEPSYLCTPKGEPNSPCLGGDQCVSGVCREDVCSSMTRAAAQALELTCLAGGVI